MAMKEADYVVIDPQARGSDAVARAFANQVAYCRDNQAPITASVCEGLPVLLGGERGGEVHLAHMLDRGHSRLGAQPAARGGAGARRRAHRGRVALHQ